MKKHIIRAVAVMLLTVMLVTAFASCGVMGDKNGDTEKEVTDIDSSSEVEETEDTEKAEATEDTEDIEDTSDVEETESEDVTEDTEADESESSDVTDTSSAETETDEGVQKYESYPYELMDLNRREFRILNCLRDQWDTISYVTADEVQGSAINDEVYRRTNYIEKTLNCRLTETNYHNSKLSEQFMIDHQSGLGELALSYIQTAGNYGSLVTHMLEGRLANLDDITTINLDEYYYVGYLTDAMSLGGRHYTTASDMQINYYEGAWVILFNGDILTENGIEYPYELVRNNEWTFEALTIMARQAAFQGTAADWTFVSGGDTVYGLSFHYDGINAMMTSMGAQYGRKDKDDLPLITCQSLAFKDRAGVLGEFFLSTDGAWLKGSGDDSTGRNPRDLFIQERIAFAGTALSIMKLATSTSEIPVGIVPMPKYDLDQENYICDAGRSGNSPVISSNYEYKDEIGLVFDLMSYEANRTFEQMYFVDHLELRANTSDSMAIDNIEMLRLIRQSITVDTALMLGVAVDLCNAITASLEKGGGNLSSTIDANIESANTNCNAIRDMFKNQ